MNFVSTQGWLPSGSQVHPQCDNWKCQRPVMTVRRWGKASSVSALLTYFNCFAYMICLLLSRLLGKCLTSFSTLFYISHKYVSSTDSLVSDGIVFCSWGSLFHLFIHPARLFQRLYCVLGVGIVKWNQTKANTTLRSCARKERGKGGRTGLCPEEAGGMKRWIKIKIKRAWPAKATCK